MKQKILLFDLETSPILALIWGLWQEVRSTDRILQDWYILSWSAAWLDDDEVMCDALCFHSLYKKEPENDRLIVESLWKLLDEADIVVAHNGRRFDVPKINARFAIHGMQPPSSYKIVDTLGIARQNFKFTSNRLDDLGQYLNVGRKMEHSGFDLWKRVVVGKEPEAWKIMVDYNVQDIILLEDVYKVLRAWDKKHPHAHIEIDADYPLCPVCGSEAIVRNGSYSTNTQVYQKHKCLDCGHSLRSRKAEKNTQRGRKNVLRSL